MNNDYQNTQTDMELEAMRRQMETLKKKLQQQEIVNDHIIRRSMKTTAGNIMRRYYVIMAICLLMIPYTYIVFVLNQELSLAFWIGTSILMLVCCGATYYNSLNVSNSNMMSSNLVEVGRRMASAKKFDANWLFFGIPAVIGWLAWLVWELYQKDADAGHYMFYGVVCGAVLGAIIGIKIQIRTQQQYQDIIDKIEDLTSNEQ
jgi:hypothetical protein